MSEERDLHINLLEMKATQLALKTFLDRLAGESVVFMSDSSTIVAYLKKHGGAVSKVMCSLAQEIVVWSELHLLAISARYIPRKKNVLADESSCPDQVLPKDWFFLPWVVMPSAMFCVALL